MREFQDRDRAFIIRFKQDNSYTTLDYLSKQILYLDNVERLGLSKNDTVTVAFSKGHFEGKIWFLGTHDEVEKQLPEAEKVMRRVAEGDKINLSDISLRQEGDAGHMENENVAGSQNLTYIAGSRNLSFSQNTNESDSDSNDVVIPKKRRTLEPSVAATNEQLQPLDNAIAGNLQKLVSLVTTLVGFMFKFNGFTYSSAEISTPCLERKCRSTCRRPITCRG